MAASSPVMQRRNSHVVVITFHGTGHILPNMMLAKQLALLGNSITLIFPNKYTYSLLISSSSSDVTQGLDIQLLPLEVDGDVGHPIRSPVQIMPGIRKSSRPGFLELDHTLQQNALQEQLQRMIASPSPPIAVIVDDHLSWAPAVIHKLKIPIYHFYTNASSHLAWRIHIADLYEQGKLPVKDGECPPDVISAPGLPQIPWQQMPPQSIPFSQTSLLQAQGILLNSSQELERTPIDAIREGIKSKIYAVGPLLLLDSMSDLGSSTSKSSTILPSTNETVCNKWLDGQLPKSVLYVSFGSRSALPDEQMMELAVGLEQSKKPFLWVIPVKHVEDSSDYLATVLPVGFCERTADRGLILPGWAPQHLILNHQATGGFLTHCGWNSTLECVSLAGVPMLCWPFSTDQPVICRYLVDELKIGVDVHEDKDGFVKHSEVLRAVLELMDSDKTDALRENATKLKHVVRSTSAGYDGSSRKSLKRFIEEIKQIITTIYPGRAF